MVTQNKMTIVDLSIEPMSEMDELERLAEDLRRRIKELEETNKGLRKANKELMAKIDLQEAQVRSMNADLLEYDQVAAFMGILRGMLAPKR